MKRFIRIFSVLMLGVVVGIFTMSNPTNLRVKNPVPIPEPTPLVSLKNITEQKPVTTAKVDTPHVITETPKTTTKKTTKTTKISSLVSDPGAGKVMDPVIYVDLSVNDKFQKPELNFPDSSKIISVDHSDQITQTQTKIAADRARIAILQAEISQCNQKITELYADMSDPSTAVDQLWKDSDELDKARQKIADDNLEIVTLVNSIGFEQSILDSYAAK